jgi:fructokinase
MTTPRVLCLGEVLFDCLADQPGRPLEQVESWTSYPGGAPANVACSLVKLGTPTGFIGCIGEDDPGTTLVELLHSIGVDGTGIQRHATAPTRKVYVLRTETGDRIFGGFGDIPTSEFADTRLQADKLPIALFETADFLVMGTLELAYPDSRAAVMRAVELAEEYYLKILIDVNWRPTFWTDSNEASAIIHQIVEKADFLKLSKEEAEWLFETTDPGVIAHRLGGVEGVLITDGEHGCKYSLGENEGVVPAFKMDVEDTTGAGDSFVAGFLHQVCQHGFPSLTNPETARQVVTYASAVGALTTTRAGAIAAQPNAAEVEAFLYMKQSGE